MSGTTKGGMPVVINLRYGASMAGAPEPPMPGIITDPNVLYRIDPHDFWGEYTLAKK
jgi:hypothetical protein